MKLIVTVIAMILPSTAFAQDPAADQSAETSADQSAMPNDLTLEQCWSNLQNCYAKLQADNARYTALLAELAQRGGFHSVDEMLAQDCRSRRGTWQDNKCVCAEPSQWFTPESEECCVPNPRAYGWNKSACDDSGGTYSCRGGCRCPMGTQLLSGHCEGEEATREEVERLRALIPELEAEASRLQGELETARASDEEDAASVAALEDELRAVRNELEWLRTLLAERDSYIRSLGGTPPETPEPPPGEGEALTPDEEIPGASEAVAAVAAESMGQEPVRSAELPDDDKSWCQENSGICALVIIGSTAAAVGLGFGIYEVVRGPPDTVRQYY